MVKIKYAFDIVVDVIRNFRKMNHQILMLWCNEFSKSVKKKFTIRLTSNWRGKKTTREKKLCYPCIKLDKSYENFDYYSCGW